MEQVIADLAQPAGDDDGDLRDALEMASNRPGRAC